MRDPWREPRTLITVAALPLATAAAVIVTYGRWRYVDLGDLFWPDIHRWPLWGMSIVMTLVTCLAGIAGAHRRTRGGILSDAALYALIVMPIVLFTFYPGTEKLGGGSDGRAFYLLVLLAVVHGVGFAVIRGAVEEAEGTVDRREDA